MTIYKSKSKPYLLFIILFVLLIISIPLNTKYYKSIMWNIYDNVLTYDLGFSSIPNLIGGNITDTSKYIIVTKKTPDIITNYIFGIENRPEIQRLDLNIKFKEYKKILNDRQRFINQGIGNKFTEVKAKLVFNDKEMKAKIRLKGDLADHWRSLYKMSFRVNLKKDAYILGYKTFSLQKPSARQHPYDQTFQELQKKIGNLSSSHNYVHLFVNGKDWGIMNIEEHMSKELLEKQKMKESLIVKFGNEQNWLLNKTIKKPYINYRLSDSQLNIKVYGSSKYLKEEDNIYRAWYSYIIKKHRDSNLSLYDTKSFTKSLILGLTWGTTHSLSNANSRYYFNPYILKLVPITTDQGHFRNLNNKLPIPLIYQEIAKSLEFEDLKNKNVDIVKNEIINSQEVIDKYQSYFPIDEKISNTILINNFNKIKNNVKDYIKIDDQKLINKQELPTKEQATYFPNHIFARHFINGEIHLYNLLPDTVTLLSINLENNKIKNLKNYTLKGFSKKDEYIPLIIKTNLKGIYDNRIEIFTNYKGNKRIYKLGYTNVLEGLNNPLLNDSNLKDLKYIKKIDIDNYKIKSGNWNINKPLVIKGNLEIEAGTVLNFSEKTYLIVKGTLNAKGTVDKNIILNAKSKKWKGIYVLNAKNTSYLENIIIQDTEALSDGLLNLTGGVNFYKSNVKIINAKFKNSVAEDSLNIVHSSFLIKNILIENSISDGFDSDYSNGKIVNSKFVKILGDAVDFSGSVVHIDNCNFFNIHDKAISSGEGSTISINNININDVGVGIASKDGSITSGINIEILNYKMKALMTYIKKPFYNKSKLILDNVDIDNIVNSFSRQKNTIMIINKKEIEEKKINVKKMYKSGVMKK